MISLETPGGPEHIAAAALESVLSLIGYNKRVLVLCAAPPTFVDVLVERGCRVSWRMPLTDPRSCDIPSAAERFEVVVVQALETWDNPVGRLREAVRQLEPTGYLVSCSVHLGHGDLRLARARGAANPAYPSVSADPRALEACADLDGLRLLLIESGLLPVEVERVIVPLFQSSLGIRRDEVSSDAVDQLLVDPEAETFLFVLKSVADNGTCAVAQLAERVSTLSSQLQGASVRMALLRYDYVAVLGQKDRAEVELVEVSAQLSEHHKYVEALEGHAAGLEAQVQGLVDEVATTATTLAALDAQYQALLRSRTVRSARALRRWGAKLTRRERQ